MDPVADPAADGAVDENDQSQIQHEGLRFVFNQTRDAYPRNPVPYYDDGDPEMYSTENLAKRKELEKNEMVVEAIKDFIANEFQCDKHGNCSKEDYFKVFMQIAMILKPGFEADDLQRVIKDDWDNDSMDKVPEKEEEPKDGESGENAEPKEAVPEVPKQYDQLDKEKLFKALFTLADTWCPTTLDTEYKEFFKQLRHRLKYQGQADAGAYDVL